MTSIKDALTRYPVQGYPAPYLGTVETAEWFLAQYGVESPVSGDETVKLDSIWNLDE